MNLLSVFYQTDVIRSSGENDLIRLVWASFRVHTKRHSQSWVTFLKVIDTCVCVSTQIYVLTQSFKIKDKHDRGGDHMQQITSSTPNRFEVSMRRCNNVTAINVYVYPSLLIFKGCRWGVRQEFNTNTRVRWLTVK